MPHTWLDLSIDVHRRQGFGGGGVSRQGKAKLSGDVGGTGQGESSGGDGMFWILSPLFVSDMHQLKRWMFKEIHCRMESLQRDKGI